MADDAKPDEQIDPITSMSVKIDNLQKQIDDNKKVMDNNKAQMTQIINTNKNLIAEIGVLKSKPSPSIIVEKSNDDIAYDSLIRNLNIKR